MKNAPITAIGQPLAPSVTFAKNSETRAVAQMLPDEWEKCVLTIWTFLARIPLSPSQVFFFDENVSFFWKIN